MERIEALAAYYAARNEDARFSSRHGSVEFITTLHYIEKYLTPGTKILEIGAGTGRYSHYLAGHGYSVDAIELMPCNIQVFKEHITPGEPVTVTQGDALDLPFADATYDMTLLLGPMYHLFTEEDQRQALSEALRVTKLGGVVFVAYCCADMTLYQYCIGRNMLKATLAQNKIDPDTFQLFSLPEDVFALHRKTDIDALMADLPVRRLHYVGTDMLVNFLRQAFDALDDEDFAFYMRYHLSICERPDLVGATNHILDIFRKNNT